MPFNRRNPYFHNLTSLQFTGSLDMYISDGNMSFATFFSSQRTSFKYPDCPKPFIYSYFLLHDFTN